MSIDGEISLGAELEETKQALNRALRKLDAVKLKQEDVVQATREAIADAARGFQVPPVKPPNGVGASGRTSNTKAAEVAILQGTDWQLGKVTPNYSTAVCEERIQRLARKVLKLTEIQRADHPVRECRVYLTGDLLEGENIFPGQAHKIDASLFKQMIVDGPRITIGLLRTLLSTFDKVHVVAVTGNHSRLQRRGLDHPETSSELMMLGAVKLAMANEPRLTWAPLEAAGERQWYAVDPVGEKSFLLWHGDQVRSGALGYSWYGFSKAISGYRMGAVPEPFDYSLSGHWHQAVRMSVGDVTHWGGPSTESMNTYAAEMMKSQGHPAQWLFFCHPRRGVSAEYLVDLMND